MTTSESLYNAILNDDINELTNGSIADYGFHTTSSHLKIHLFGAYQSISKFLTKKQFINQMHSAYLKENLHETVDKLTKTLVPVEFQNHWNTFISLGGKIVPIYI
jgi:virulence-associated protein VapD